jgi:hypothetical protein
LPSWPKHQKWEKSDKIKTGIEACLKELPKEVKDRLKEIGYQYPMDTGYIPPAYSSSYSDSDSDLDIDSDKELPSLPTEALSFSTLLYTLHQEQIDAKAKKPTESAAREWANSIDMLHRLDGRDWPDIEKAIRWIKTPGNFWAPNIMSGQTLRRQFDKVWAQMAQRPKEDSHQDHVRSFVERIEAEEKSKRESGILG